jgi:hypothetical protein
VNTDHTGARRAARRLLFAATVALSLVILFAPGSDVPTAPTGTDKLVHLALFAALAVTGRRAGIGARPLVLVLVAYAVGSEVAQGLLAGLGRSPSGWDAAADCCGALLGLAIANRPRR